ncbi:MAG: hypothetical protein ACJAVN_001686, partial [Roseivirga sp.]
FIQSVDNYSGYTFFCGHSAIPFLFKIEVGHIGK